MKTILLALSIVLASVSSINAHAFTPLSPTAITTQVDVAALVTAISNKGDLTSINKVEEGKFIISTRTDMEYLDMVKYEILIGNILPNILVLHESNSMGGYQITLWYQEAI